MSEDRGQESGVRSEAEQKPPPALLNGAADEPDDAQDDSPPAPQSWREDWRTALAAGDERRAKQLERYATPEAVANAYFVAQNRIRSGRAVAPEPPEEATDVELSAWRKQAGIPDAPEGYEIAWDDADENDKATLTEYLKYAHSKHLTPRAVKESVEWFKNTRAATVERAEQAADDATRDNLAELRQIYPKGEYKRNIGLANDYLNSHFAGPDAKAQLDTILGAKLPNGVQLTNYPPFVQMIVAMARHHASEDDLVSGEAGGGARSVDEEWKELGAKPKLTEAEYARMQQLAEARIKRQERTAAR
jgi:hypothetical protein